MVLLDTNVVFELRRPQKADRNVVAWASTIPAASFFLSAISILEIELGALLIERKHTPQGAVLRAWSEPAGFAWNLTEKRWGLDQRSSDNSVPRCGISSR